MTEPLLVPTAVRAFTPAPKKKPPRRRRRRRGGFFFGAGVKARTAVGTRRGSVIYAGFGRRRQPHFPTYGRRHRRSAGSGRAVGDHSPTRPSSRTGTRPSTGTDGS